ncbi:enoyl-CoA delta isomerase 1, mitochondrial isoform X1 [Phascolarctos cinereus]|uniref:Enoyl-CoA delta isomerase 1, mitochondrial n=1 Tax=Phascolarctos cinereus TaxID=38626 RepID=A0A6P5M2E0_PHACI|nr:enoyl-CoA delta isomerase 1, mitochondrial isoform X1 [Phascolarctos cinereus]
MALRAVSVLKRGLGGPGAGLLRSGTFLLCASQHRLEKMPSSIGFPATSRPFSSHQILVDVNQNLGVATIKLKNPPVNSLSLELLTEFVISWEKLENDKSCRGVILTSNIPKIFSAGLDITEMCGKNAAHYAEFWKAVQELWLKLYTSNMVVIAAINGSSPAGGCLMSLASDYRIMADDPKYTIGLNETLLGIVAPFWLKDTLVNTIGNRASEHALQRGLLFPPADAFKIGLVDQIVPEDKVQSTALSMMSEWLTIPDHARQLTKTMMRKPTVDQLLKQREADIQNFVGFISKDSIQKSLHMYLKFLKERKG